MPICNNASMTTSNKSSVAVDDHASEAAKMKRTREQAYFNSYDFDAIEVLPYEDDEEEEEEEEDDEKLQSQSTVTKPPTSVNRGLHSIQSGLIVKYRGLGSMSARKSQRQHRRVKNGSLSSKSSSNVASSSSSTRSSSSISGHRLISRNNYPYLHSLGTLLAGTKSKIIDGEDRTTVLDAEFGSIKNAKGLDVNSLNEIENGNFSLPRANLKYQSISDTLNAVSMPSVVNTKIIAPPTSLNGTMNNKNIVLMPFNSSSGSQAHILHMDDGQVTTLQMLSKSSSVANNGNSSVLRNKKPSSSSTATSILTLATVDDSCVNADVQASKAAKAEPMNNISRNGMETTIMRTPTKTITAISMQKSKRAGSSGGSSAESEKAASWQQSHYSTNKSGSSGYYSSNVCSTYSLEDHIYCEPVVNGGVLDISKTKSKSEQLTRQIRNRTNDTVAADVAISIGGSGIESELLKSKQLMTNNRLDILHSIGTDDKDAAEAFNNNVANTQGNSGGMSFNENLRVLETSIENLDRHLRNIPSLNNQEAAFVHTHAPSFSNQDVNEKKHLPTIMEGPTSQPRSWPDDIADDSLMDIDLDSFLLSNDQRKRVNNNNHNPTPNGGVVNASEGIVNPSFLSDEQEENHYKCAKYINSCPEDAYRVESDIVTTSETSDVRDQFLKRYENQLHFESTRDLLEDVRDKIRLLSQSTSNTRDSMIPAIDMVANEREGDSSVMPKELEAMIKALKRELESYLARMNQHSEREIRQLCTGIVKNQKVVRMTKAFERRRSEIDISGGFNNGVFTPASGVPLSIRQQITSIRCASDPNFKMKRKSLADVFPAMANTCYTDSQQSHQQQNGAQLQWQPQHKQKSTNEQQRTQLQRNLSFHQPMLLNHLNSKANTSSRLNVNSTTTDIRYTNGIDNVGSVNCTAGGTGGIGSAAGSETGEQAGDKESILEWHRKKPSIWEMYYGTNRLNQSLLAAQRNVKQQLATINSQPTTMSYPSSRPESDFTLDLPRAEQLRIKMEKEKKFRQRCRYITAFLSLMFFLLTVMVVSMVLTRGKRMFGSMI